MPVKCPRCKKFFENGLSFSIHSKSCLPLLTAAKNQFKKQGINNERKKAKLARRDNNDSNTLSQERQEIRNGLVNDGAGASDLDPEIEIPDIKVCTSWYFFWYILINFVLGPDTYPPSSPPPIVYHSSGRIKRRARLPARFRDDLPPVPVLIIDEDSHSIFSESPPTASDVPTTPLEIIPFRTDPDSYGIFREYSHGCPTLTPDEHHNLSDMSESPNLACPSSKTPVRSALDSQLEKSVNSIKAEFFAPFRNPSLYRLFTWFHAESNTKSIPQLNSLVKDVILAPDFKPEDFIGFNAVKENEVMDRYRETPNEGQEVSPFAFDDRWIKGSVEISLPCDGVKHASEAAAPKYKVELYYRKPLEIIKSAFAETEAEKFHTIPFKAFWKPSPNEPEERIYSEIFTGDVFNKEYNKIRGQVRDSLHSQLEPVMAGLMIYSDSTSLAQFGTAELWPIYLYFGNQSKYSRSKPSSFAAHHLVYMPKVRN